MTVTLHRKREILALAVEHDLLILEGFFSTAFHHIFLLKTTR
jgi:hypothetical protein